MFYVIGFVIVVVIISYFIHNKLVIRIDTFFRKGFKKLVDKYRGLYFRRKATEMVKHYHV